MYVYALEVVLYFKPSEYNVGCILTSGYAHYIPGLCVRLIRSYIILNFTLTILKEKDHTKYVRIDGRILMSLGL
jgi:hypothetical protein